MKITTLLLWFCFPVTMMAIATVKIVAEAVVFWADVIRMVRENRD